MPTGNIGAAQVAAAAKNKAKAKTKNVTSTLAEDTSGNAPADVGTTKTSLSGLPVGTKIRVGTTQGAAYSGGTPKAVSATPVYAKATYTPESVYSIPASLSNSEKANLLLQLAYIPGLYATGQAPTQDYIRRMGDGITLRPEDYTAFTKVLTVADQSGQDYSSTLLKFINNPSMSQQFFGKVTATAKQIITSSPDALSAELNSRYLDMFNVAPDKKTTDAYIKEITTMEKKAGMAGQNLTSQQREDVFNKYVANSANTLFAKVKGTPDTTDDKQIEQGALGATVRLIRNAYSDNGIPIKEGDVYKLAIKSTRSQQALQNTLDDINMQASIQFPALKDWLAKGKTAKAFFSPYISAYSKIYGTPEDQVDITKFHDVAAGTSVVPVNQWIKDQWKNPEIKNTQYYKETNRNDLRAVADAFGMVI